jgi:hypothetical protein
MQLLVLNLSAAIMKQGSDPIDANSWIRNPSQNGGFRLDLRSFWERLPGPED